MSDAFNEGRKQGIREALSMTQNTITREEFLPNTPPLSTGLRYIEQGLRGLLADADSPLRSLKVGDTLTGDADEQYRVTAIVHDEVTLEPVKD